jgi:ankyrin repeat protein
MTANKDWRLNVTSDRQSSLPKPCLMLLAGALMVSCDSPQKIALRKLTESGVEPSGRSLVRAVTERDAETAALLLEARVHTEQRDPAGRTPLSIAVEQGDLAATSMLINAGANLNATLANRASVLGIAARRGDMLMMDTLLAAGSRSDGLMPDGDKILPWAIRHGRPELVRTMMKADSDPHLKDRQGNPLLHVAMEAGRRDLMETLIDLGADPGTTNAAGETTIQLALRHGWTDLVPKLAAAGADPNAAGPDGFTLLGKALAERDVERVSLFLIIGADPHFPSRAGDPATPFQKVFADPDPAQFSLFLSHGVKPSEGAWDASLWQTFHRRDLAKARLILSHGAREPKPGKNRLHLIEAAVLRRDADFTKLLLDYGLPARNALPLACSRGDHEMAGLLLACGISPEKTLFPSHDTLLTRAVRTRQDRIAELLVLHGANTRHRLPEGQSLLHLAIATGCPLTLRQLLMDGADPNAPFTLPVSPEFLKTVRPGVMRWVLKMDRNATPLMLAADSGNIHVARQLIRAGAKTSVRTRFSDLWPINFACRRADVPMIRLFLGRDPFREDRVVEIRLSEQRARVFDASGAEILNTKVSTGRRGYATPTGEFAITNKHRDWTSTLYHASMPYFQRLSCSDFGLHQGIVPGYPASHGCIRVPAGTAAKLFEMLQTGDRVRILP